MLTFELVLNLLNEKEKEQYEKLTQRAKDLFRSVVEDTILLCGINTNSDKTSELIAFKYDNIYDVFEAEELGNYIKFFRIFKLRMDEIARQMGYRS